MRMEITTMLPTVPPAIAATGVREGGSTEPGEITSGEDPGLPDDSGGTADEVNRPEAPSPSVLYSFAVNDGITHFK